MIKADNWSVRELVGRWMIRLEGTSTRRIVAWMIALFALYHFFYWTSGVRFNANPLTNFWQYLDPELLRHRLLESLFYLHSQPPAFNLFLGLVLKFAPGYEGQLFHGVYLTLGLVLYLTLFLLLQWLGVSKWLALLVSTLFVVSPSFVLYEHWLFYPFPLAALLAGSALILGYLLHKENFWLATVFFGTLFILCTIRSIFHLGYYLLLVAGVVLVARRNRRAILAAAVLPGFLLTGIYVKNLVLFDKFSTSGWLGMHFWSMTGRNLALGERMRLVEEGKLSQVSVIQRFSELEVYPEEYLRRRGFEGIAAVKEVRKSTGSTNYNHLAYIDISDQYMDDALYVLTHYPRTYLIGLVRSWFAYLASSADDDYLLERRRQLRPVDELYNYVFYGKVPYNLSRTSWLPIYSQRRHYAYVFLLFGLPLLFVYGVRVGMGRSRAWRTMPRERRLVVLYLCLSIAYVALLGNAFEAAENNRYRFMTDPFYVVLAGLAVQGALGQRGRRESVASFPRHRPDRG